jgi:hypothetical protein
LVPSASANVRLRTTTRRFRIDVAELDDEHPTPHTVLGDLEEIHEADEAGPLGKLGRDIGEGDLEQSRDENLSGWERIAATDLHLWSLPQTNGGGDLATTDAITERTDELHGYGLWCASQPQILAGARSSLLEQRQPVWCRSNDHSAIDDGSRHEPSVTRVLPNGKPRTGGAPGINRFVVRALPPFHPLDEIEDEVFDSICHRDVIRDVSKA